MHYEFEGIARGLKAARERKGLSQRDLSARSGVHQYQISKIENGTVDLRLSSLIALARALELDLKLIPRMAVPAVDSIVRSTRPTVASRPALKELNRTLDTLKGLRAVFPEIRELARLHGSIRLFANFTHIGREMDALRTIARPVRQLRKLVESSQGMNQGPEIPADLRTALRQAASAADNLRNRLVDPAMDVPPPARPAYSLDEDDDG